MGHIAHLGHVEVYTDRFEDSLDFFTRVYGLKLSGRDETSAYLRAWDDYEFCSLKLTRHHTTGVGHIGYRAASAQALADQVAIIESSGFKTHGWTAGDHSHGPAFRFEDPFGHIFEIYWQTNRYAPSDADRPALKNMASRYTAQGRAAPDRPSEPSGHRRRRIPPLHGNLSGQPRDRDDPTGQWPHRGLLVHRQQQDL